MSDRSTLNNQQDTIQDYEDRIKALESKIQSVESAMEASVSNQWNWKDWFERYGLLLAWGALILLLGAVKPEQMFAWNSYATMFGSNAMIVALTLALLLPLTTGDYELLTRCLCCILASIH